MQKLFQKLFNMAIISYEPAEHNEKVLEGFNFIVQSSPKKKSHTFGSMCEIRFAKCFFPACQGQLKTLLPKVGKCLASGSRARQLSRCSLKQALELRSVYCAVTVILSRLC